MKLEATAVFKVPELKFCLAASQEFLVYKDRTRKPLEKTPNSKCLFPHECTLKSGGGGFKSNGESRKASAC